MFRGCQQNSFPTLLHSPRIRGWIGTGWCEKELNLGARQIVVRPGLHPHHWSDAQAYPDFASITKDRPMPDIGALYLEEAFRTLRGVKRQADAAMEQLNDAQFFAG